MWIKCLIHTTNLIYAGIYIHHTCSICGGKYLITCVGYICYIWQNHIYIYTVNFSQTGRRFVM